MIPPNELKILNKILTHRIHKYIKYIISFSEEEFLAGMQK